MIYKCDVDSSHPPAVVGGKGPTVRRLKWYASWVNNTSLLSPNINTKCRGRETNIS